MKVQDLLKDMENRALNDSFLSGLYAFYDSQVQKGELGDVEKDYDAHLPLLLELLTPNLTDLLMEAFALYEKRRAYCATFGFKRGMFGGFRQFFSEDPLRDGGFTEYILNDLMIQPKMQRYHEYYTNLTRCNQIEEMILSTLSEGHQKYCTSIFCALQQREYSAAHNSLFLGYCYAYNIIEHAVPTARIENIDKILTTEFFLGFTKPHQDAERLQKQAVA